MVYVLMRGDKVRLRNGLVATITFVSDAKEFMYLIDGTCDLGNGVKRNYSWTRNGKYYTDEIDDDRDIVEVVS